MADKLAKAQTEAQTWQAKIVDVKAQAETVRGELETKRAALGDTILAGGDADKLLDEITKLESRARAFDATMKAAHTKHAQALAEMKAAELERDRARDVEISKQLADGLQKFKAALQTARAQLETMATLQDEARGNASRHGYSYGDGTFAMAFDARAWMNALDATATSYQEEQTYRRLK